MDLSNILIFLGCIILIFFIARIFVVPLKIVFRILGNSILGGVIIFIVNIFGNMFGFHIGLNVVTTIIVGILGIPRFNFACLFTTSIMMVENIDFL